MQAAPRLLSSCAVLSKYVTQIKPTWKHKRSDERRVKVAGRQKWGVKYAAWFQEDRRQDDLKVEDRGRILTRRDYKNLSNR